jgi:hypothetical protein
MLRELEKIVSADGEASLEELQSAAAKLRDCQFIHRSKSSMKNTYELLIRYQSYYTNLFSAFGDEFIIDYTFEVCGIIPCQSRPSMKYLDTVYLLILAKLHNAECRFGGSENGRTQPNEAILLDEYCRLTGRDRPKTKDTRDSLERLARRQVIELGEVSSATDMATITVLPAIMYVVTSEWLTKLQAFEIDNASSRKEVSNSSTPTETSLTGSASISLPTLFTNADSHSEEDDE